MDFDTVKGFFGGAIIALILLLVAVFTAYALTSTCKSPLDYALAFITTIIVAILIIGGIASISEKL